MLFRGAGHHLAVVWLSRVVGVIVRRSWAFVEQLSTFFGRRDRLRQLGLCEAA